jgi:type IV pilus assembly protein PilM
MSSPNPIVVNCGATHVSVSVFSAKAGRLVLEKFFVRSLNYDYTDDNAWTDALAEGLRALVKTARVSGTATVIVPGYRLLTKNIKVPLADAGQMKQVVAFEAQRSLPDFDEMVWDSQAIASDDVESEVALFAHRTVDALRFTKAVSASGLKPEIVEAATLLDFQAYRFARGGVIEDDVLLVNIGARSTNLTFVTPEGFSIQNTTVGGNLLTQSLADALGEPFEVAEELKVHFFMEGADEARMSGGEANQKIAAVLKSKAADFNKRLAQEISRRLINYKRQNKGRGPSRIELTGRASLLPGLREHLAEVLHLDVDYFEPAAALTLGRSVPAGVLESINRFQMSEVVGEAARLVLTNPAGVNLLPPEIAADMAFSKKKPFFILAAILFAVAPWPLWFEFNKAGEIMNKRLNDARAEALDYELYLKGDKATGAAEPILFRKRADEDEAPAPVEFKSKKQKLRFFRQSGAVIKDGVETIHKNAEDLGKQVRELDTLAAARDNWLVVLAELQKAIVVEGRHTWVEKFEVARQPLPTLPPNAKPTDPLPRPLPASLLITVRALLEEVPPGGAINSEAENKKFKEVGERLKKIPFAAEVSEISTATDPARANLPVHTFKLTVKPEFQL